MAGPWEKYKQPDQAQAATGPWAKYQQQPADTAPPPAAPKEPSMTQQALTGAKNFGIGALKGVGNTLYNLGAPAGYAAQKLGITHETPEQNAQQRQLFEPTTTGQQIGKGVEQAAEFMIPGGAEEKAASYLPKIAQPLGRIGLSALGSGAVNKLQGGSFKTGAEAGAAGGALGAGMKAVAPAIAESALGIRGAARAFGKTPGKAVLEETRGIRPETVASSAQERLNTLNPQLESAAARSTTPANLNPARQVIGNEMRKASAQNAPTLHGQLGRQAETLSRNFQTGQPIPSQISPSELLNLKRGFNEEHLGWNPEMHQRALSAGRNAYGALDKELDRTVPEAQQLNQRISSLIPVTRRAEAVGRNDSALSRGLGRFGAHTGALTLGGLGAAEGGRERGVPGAIVGGLTGVLAPELIASPTGQMAAARLLNRSGALRPIVGGALQATRDNNQ